MNSSSDLTFDRSHFKRECKLIYGMHPSGLLEIKIHNPKKKNAIFAKTHKKLAELFRQANTDESIKCILLHGGDYFSAGNDLEAFWIGEDPGRAIQAAHSAARVDLVGILTSLFDLEKPLVAMVKGPAVGIGFTMLTMADFVYCTPESIFFAPFMQSFQSPEGGSSYFFPRVLGPRKTAETLMGDQILTAQQAYEYGYVNKVLHDFPRGEFFDVTKVPCMPKLLKNNVNTMVTAKRLINQAMDR